MRVTGGDWAQQKSVDVEVVWAGEWTAALDALRRRGVFVAHVPKDRCLDQVESRAPDLVVLSGTAALSATAMANELRRRSPGATLPVVVLSADAGPFDARHRRAGIVLCLTQSLEAEAAASQIVERLLHVAAMPSHRALVTSWRDVDDWLAAAMKGGSSGVLVTTDPVSAIAVGPNGRLSPTPNFLRRTLRRPKTDEPASMKFFEIPADRLVVLRDPAAPPNETANLSGASVVVVHPDAARRQALRAALAASGAAAHAVGVDAGALVASLAPTLVVISTEALLDESAAGVWEDARLSSVSWLVLDEAELGPMDASRIVAPAASLCATGRSIRRRLAAGGLLVGRIESFGPAGWLTEVGRCTQPTTMVLRGVRGRVELSLAGGKIKKASFVPGDRRAAGLEGRAALDVLRSMPFGRVLAGPHDLVLRSETALSEDGIIETLCRPRTSAAATQSAHLGRIAPPIPRTTGAPTPTPMTSPSATKPANPTSA